MKNLPLNYTTFKIGGLLSCHLREDENLVEVRNVCSQEELSNWNIMCRKYFLINALLFVTL
jgi:hypothetical protein